MATAAYTTALDITANVTLMASKRPVLASIPNAVNSPLRSLAVAGKRSRAQAGDARDAPLHEQPPFKKQAIELNKYDNGENIDPHARHDELDPRKSTTVMHPSAFEKRLAASRERKDPSFTADTKQHQGQQSHNNVKMRGDDLENLRQWQRHYRRQFPLFVFYFDSVPEDARSKLLRQVHSLGAREEKFFSNAVTHVVTTRQVPAPTAVSVKDDINQSKVTSTLNPVLTDRNKTASMLDSTLQRRTQLQQTRTTNEIDSRRFASQAADVLTRARKLNIKIWTYEKLQRVLRSMLETDTGEHVLTETKPSTTTMQKQPTKSKDADLEQLLRNEKINGPADRDMTVTTQDMVSFKGCYIYVHDMDERTKPSMLRDYPKPSTKEEGKWPMFRMSSLGRCPFLEDPASTKQQQELERKQARANREQLRRTRASTTETSQQPLAERDCNLRRSPRKQAQETDLAKPLDPPKLVPAKRQSSNDSQSAVFASAQINLRGLPRMIGGVPIASGIQRSNVTSAIRSQAISSAAISSTAPGMTRRVTDGKEVSALKRRVLERGASANSQLPSSYMNDMRAAINDEPAPPARAAKRKAQESILGAVPEDEESNAAAKQRKARSKKAKTERDPKPGYCENCRDKFDDFEEHCNSRKHLKFARSAENYKELDDLLALLKRPRKAV